MYGTFKPLLFPWLGQPLLSFLCDYDLHLASSVLPLPGLAQQSACSFFRPDPFCPERSLPGIQSPTPYP